MSQSVARFVKKGGNLFAFFYVIYYVRENIKRRDYEVVFN